MVVVVFAVFKIIFFSGFFKFLGIWENRNPKFSAIWHNYFLNSYELLNIREFGKAEFMIKFCEE